MSLQIPQLQSASQLWPHAWQFCAGGGDGAGGTQPEPHHFAALPCQEEQLSMQLVLLAAHGEVVSQRRQSHSSSQR